MPDIFFNARKKDKKFKFLCYFYVFMVFAMFDSARAAQTTMPLVIHDPAMDSIVSSVREDFLKTQPFNLLNATILVRQEDGSWREGSFNPDGLYYPASCVKLAYLAGAMHWCRENGHRFDYLDASVRPMIEISSNEKTGEVVDAITSAPNIADLVTTGDPRYAPWIDKRMYTWRYLDSLGLLRNQTIINKTYPSNTSQSPEGAEKVARAERGMNKMQPRASAMLMLGLISGAIEPQANTYMRELLDHEMWKGNSVTSHALQPGSTYFNKPGNAYDTVADIAYVRLPNKCEFALAVFSNAFVAPYSRENKYYNKTILSLFAERLIERLDLLKGCPPRIVLDAKSMQFSAQGKWDEATTPTQFRGSFMQKVGGSGEAKAGWKLSVPDAGKYEVCVWYPQAPDRSKKVPFHIEQDDGGTTTILVDQTRVGGQWFRLGDFKFARESGSVTVSDDIGSTTETVVINAVRATKWP